MRQGGLVQDWEMEGNVIHSILDFSFFVYISVFTWWSLVTVVAALGLQIMAKSRMQCYNIQVKQKRNIAIKDE